MLWGGQYRGSFPMLTPAPAHPIGGNRITQAVPGAHDGGVFGLCALRDGTLVSGGGRDRRVVFWGPDYSKLQEVEVRRGRGSYEGEGTPPLPSTSLPAPPLCVSSLFRVCSPRCPRTLAPCALWQRAGETRCTWGPPATASCRARSTRASRCSSR